MGYDVTKIFQGAPMVKLGELIEECDLRNSDNTYTLNDLKGISIEKKFIETKANMDGVSLTSYKIVKPKWVSFVPVTSRNVNKISLAFNDTKNTFIVSSAYTVFAVKNEEVLDASYLFLMLQRSEFDRIARFNSWGSARETYMFSDLARYEIPLPAIEVQREYVAAYRSLQQLAEQNEALAAPLQDACFSHLARIKITFKSVSLSDYIEQCTDKNSNNEFGVESLQGVTSESVFDTSKAKTEGLKFDTYKIVYENDFAYNPSRINLGSIALRKGNPCIISPMYVVFRLTLKGKLHILPEFLLLRFLRKEFLRSTIFYASGSVRDTFDFYAMQQVKIPLPPIEVQRSIVALYNCAEEARAIAKEAREQLKILAPAMVQRAANTPVEV